MYWESSESYEKEQDIQIYGAKSQKFQVLIKKNFRVMKRASVVKSVWASVIKSVFICDSSIFHGP